MWPCQNLGTRAGPTGAGQTWLFGQKALIIHHLLVFVTLSTTTPPGLPPVSGETAWVGEWDSG